MGEPTVPLRERESSGLNRARLGLELRRSVGPFLVFAGLVVAALISGAILLKNISAQTPFGDYREVRVAVDDAKGVVPGQQDVRLAGVRIGKITSVELSGRQPVLTLSIEAEHAPLYRDARLRLRPATPLQELYVSVEDRGSAASGELAADGVLGAERTRVPVDISRVLNVFDPPTRERFEAMIDEMGRGLDDGGERLRAALAELTPFLRAAERLTRETAVRRKQSRRLVHNLRLLVDELARRDRQLRRLVSSGSDTFGELAGASDSVDRLLFELPPMLAELRSSSTALDLSLGELEPALVALRPTADALEPALGALHRLGHVGEPAFGALREATGELVPLTRELRPLAPKLETAFARLGRSAPRLDRSTAAIVPCELFVQKFFNWTASMVKFRDALASYPRAEGVPGPLPFIEGPSCTAEGGR